MSEAENELAFVREIAAELEAFNPTIPHSTPERHHLDRALLALWAVLRAFPAARHPTQEQG